MKKIKKFLLVLLLAFVYSCSTNNYPSSSYQYTYDRKQEYYKQALQAVEAFRVPDKKEYYGFSLGAQLENWNVNKYMIDEKTGGRIYSLPDIKGVFDVVGIHTDNNGTILSITAIKKLDDYDKQMALFKIIKDQLDDAYPTYQIVKTGYNGVAVRTITIKSAENDSEWVKKYAEHLEKEETNHRLSLVEGFAWILHPTLAEIECVVIGKIGDGGVSLTYTGKEYIRMEHLHNTLLKEKLKDL